MTPLLMMIIALLIIFLLIDRYVEYDRKKQMDLLDYEYLKNAIPLQIGMIESLEKLLQSFKRAEETLGKELPSVKATEDKIQLHKQELADMQKSFDKLKLRYERKNLL